jgi:hypothetical protein
MALTWGATLCLNSFSAFLAAISSEVSFVLLPRAFFGADGAPEPPSAAAP